MSDGRCFVIRWPMAFGCALVIALLMTALAARTEEALADETLTSTKNQSGEDQSLTFQTANLTKPVDPYTFNTPQNAVSVTIATVTATLFDGDTGPGDFDRDQLFLGLDGIDTGIALNGFDSGITDTATNTGTPQNGAQIAAALTQDGALQGTIIDHSPFDNSLSIPDTFQTTLTINVATVPDTAAPDTQITQSPNQKTRSRTATFGFTSTEPGSSFECSLDGKTLFKPCVSPFTVKVKPGKHTFTVQAIDPAGNADATPASDDWKRKKKKRKK
jgi:hypothetical protein